MPGTASGPGQASVDMCSTMHGSYWLSIDTLPRPHAPCLPHSWLGWVRLAWAHTHAYYW